MARKSKLEGLENARKVFERLPREFLEGITHALNQGADEIVDAAKILAPEGPQEPHVKDTIRRTDIRVRADGKSAVVFVTTGDTKQTANAAFRSEFGRAPGGSGKVDMGKHPGHREQPFMFPAYFAKRKRVRSRVKRAIKKAAVAEAARGRRGI